MGFIEPTAFKWATDSGGKRHKQPIRGTRWKARYRDGDGRARSPLVRHQDRGSGLPRPHERRHAARGLHRPHRTPPALLGLGQRLVGHNGETAAHNAPGLLAAAPQPRSSLLRVPGHGRYRLRGCREVHRGQDRRGPVTEKGARRGLRRVTRDEVRGTLKRPQGQPRCRAPNPSGSAKASAWRRARHGRYRAPRGSRPRPVQAGGVAYGFYWTAPFGTVRPQGGQHRLHPSPRPRVRNPIAGAQFWRFPVPARERAAEN